MEPTHINSLGPLCLFAVFSNLTAKDCAAALCVQRLWRELLQDDRLWAKYLDTDYAWKERTTLDRKTYPTFIATYGAWERDFFGVDKALVRRSAHLFGSLKSWVGANLPEVLETINPGTSNAEIAEAEQELGHPFPPALRAIYRIANGQDTTFDNKLKQKVSTGRDVQLNFDPSCFHGLLGGYSFYEHIVSVRLFSLQLARFWTLELKKQRIIRNLPSLFVFAASFNLRKVFLVDLTDGSIVVHQASDDMLANFGLHNAAPLDSGSNDGVLRWLEEYARRLQHGWYEVTLIDEERPYSRGINLFPLQPPAMTVAVTQGVQVRASAIFAPERSPPGRSVFTYSIRFSLLPKEEQMKSRTAAYPLTSCQLMTRHWVIRNAAGEVEDEVRGDAVIGLYPLLRPGEKEFVYQSCTVQKDVAGSMSGDFKFVEGTISSPTGPEWEVQCPEFFLKVPEYIY